MTALMERLTPSKNPHSASGAAPFGAPQVNLLPPEVRAARRLRVLRRWLAVALVLVVAAIVGVYVLAVGARSAAQERLDQANDTTAQLQDEQRKYAEVPRVLAAEQAVKKALAAGTATEILWKPYTDAIAAVLPANVSIDSVSMSGPSPLDSGAVTSSDPLASDSIGSISFAGRTKTVPDTAAWLDALAAVPGFTNPWASSVSATEEDGEVFYTVSLTVQLTDEALAHRFDSETGK
jgi:Tfp pilus assembly protein PilN